MNKLLRRITLLQYFWLLILAMMLADYLFTEFFTSKLLHHGEVIPIALVGPMRLSGQGAKQSDDVVKGSIMRQSVLLYEQRYNSSLREGQRPIKINVYNDKNSSEPAFLRHLAKRIAADGNIAVIGHRSSRISEPAAALYAELGIPLIGGSATGPGITENNPWSFRVVPDNHLQAKMALGYIRSSGLFQGVQNVAVLYSDDEYGREMSTAFTAESLAVEGAASENSSLAPLQVISFAASLPRNRDYDDGDAVSVLREMELSGVDFDIIFLAAHDQEGRFLIKALRDRTATQDVPIIGSSSIGKQGFPAYLQQLLPRGSAQVQRYTENLLALSPVLFDIGGEAAQEFYASYKRVYGVLPDSSAASYYDAIHAVATAYQSIPHSEALDIHKQRSALRDALARYNSPENTLQGLASEFYFDVSGNVVRPLKVAEFVGDRLVSAPVQVGYFHGRPVRTQVVYTALKFLDISHVSVEENAFTATFSIWFRGASEAAIDDVVFSNALDEATLKPEELVEQNTPSVQDGVTHRVNPLDMAYRRYNATRTFSLSQRRGRSIFGEYIAGIDFQHASAPRYQILYATDLRGDDGPALLRSNAGLDISIWRVQPMAAFQTSERRPSLGEPKLLNARERDLTVSKYRSALLLREKSFSLRGAIPPNLERIIFGVSLLGWVLVAFLLSWLPQRKLLLVRSIVHAFALLTAEPILMALSERWELSQYSHMLSKSFSVLWWLLFFTTVNQAINVYLWDTLDRAAMQRNRDAGVTGFTPTILRTLSGVVCYGLGVLAVIHFVFQLNITHLLATSGLITLIVGLALQPNLADLFSGVVLNIEKPFRIGDRISVSSESSDVCGKVINMSWRATQIRVSDDTVVSIPNGVLTAANISKIHDTASE